MLSKSDYTFVSTWAKKRKAVYILGGRCVKCGFNDWTRLTFHHIEQEEKDDNINRLLKYRWSKVEKELPKCQLLCGNCHSEKHTDPDKRASLAKVVLLKWKGVERCSECGYKGANFGSLDFHHTGDDKEFSLGDFTARRLKTLEEAVTEIDKCIVICRNCHMKKHINPDRLSKFAELIRVNSDNIQENRPPLDQKDLLAMEESGLGVLAIAKKIGYPKSTVSMALKKARIKFGITPP